MALLSCCSPTVAHEYRRCTLPLPAMARCQWLEISSRGCWDELAVWTIQEDMCYAAGTQEGMNVKPVGGDLESSMLRPAQQLFCFVFSYNPQNVHSNLRCNYTNVVRKVCFGFVPKTFQSQQWREEEISPGKHGASLETFYLSWKKAILHTITPRLYWASGCQRTVFPWQQKPLAQI